MSSLPPISDAALPTDVRAGTQADKDRYKVALSFERQLVEQLTQQMADTTQDATGGDSGSDDGGTPSSAATDTYKQMLPGVLADSITEAGGLGLARSIAQNLKEAGQ